MTEENFNVGDDIAIFDHTDQVIGTAKVGPVTPTQAHVLGLRYRRDTGMIIPSYLKGRIEHLTDEHHESLRRTRLMQAIKGRSQWLEGFSTDTLGLVAGLLGVAPESGGEEPMKDS